MFKFTPIDITDLIAILALGIGFIISIVYNMNELAMSIATGFFGYVGGVVNGSNKAQEKMKNYPEEFEETEKPQPQSQPTVTNFANSSKGIPDSEFKPITEPKNEQESPQSQLPPYRR